MKKLILLAIFGLLILIPFPVMADTPLKGRINDSYGVDRIRLDAFRQAQNNIDISMIPKIDPYLIENKIEIAKGSRISENRSITVFTDGDYTVSELCSPLSFYYAADGRFYEVDRNSSPIYYNDTCPAQYPSKSWEYGTFDYKQGDLYRIRINVSSDESFMFKPDGTFTAHWVGTQCFNAEGSLCSTKEFVFEKHAMAK